MTIINQQNADVIMVTETWLTIAIPDEALHFHGFIIFRKDRPTRRGGGVVIYIRESIPYKIRVDLCNLDYECLWITTIRPKWLPRKISKLALACVYLPPSMNIEAVESLYECCCYSNDILISGSPSTSIIIAGDFNPISNGFQERVLINNYNKSLNYTPKNDQVDAILIWTGLNNVVLPTLFRLVINIEQYCYTRFSFNNIVEC